jgi:plasmid stabilization system protein ParE
MRVRFSTAARAYVVKEMKYLASVSRSGAERFGDIVKRAQALVAEFPASGIGDSAIPLTGARRIIVTGYLFDYDLIDEVVWIQTVRSSVTVQTIAVEDDRDYEE